MRIIAFITFGSSLQANVALTVAAEDHVILSSLGDDLKFVFITSAIDLVAGEALSSGARASKAIKCERCWHYQADVGTDAAHPTLCGRCTSNLYGAGEARAFAATAPQLSHRHLGAKLGTGASGSGTSVWAL
jgi:isoleucyl-tRNA synthetase